MPHRSAAPRLHSSSWQGSYPVGLGGGRRDTADVPAEPDRTATGPELRCRARGDPGRAMAVPNGAAKVCGPPERCRPGYPIRCRGGSARSFGLNRVPGRSRPTGDAGCNRSPADARALPPEGGFRPRSVQAPPRMFANPRGGRGAMTGYGVLLRPGVASADRSAVLFPTTMSALPVTNAAASEAGKTATPMMSSSRPVRPSLISSSSRPTRSRSGPVGSVSGVPMKVGQNAFTRMPSAPHSITIDWMEPSTACFVAEQTDRSIPSTWAI